MEILTLIALLLPLSLLLFAISALRDKFQRDKYESSAYAKRTEKTWREVRNDVGAYGEYLTGLELERAFPDSLLFFNVYLPAFRGGTSEIDVLMITERGFYVFESKNYSGWIYGNEGDRNWTAVLNANTKNRFYNPIAQNETHVKWLCKYIGISPSDVHSVVVFSERCEIKDLTLSGKTPVVKRGSLVSAVTKIERSIAEVRFDEAFRRDAARKILLCCNVPDSKKEEHVRRVRAQHF